MKRNDRGQALVETLLLGLLLLAPLVWLLMVLAEVHSAALASGAAAREAGLAVSRSVDGSDARRVLDSTVQQAFADQGLDEGPVRVDAEWAGGLARGGSVRIEIAYPVEVLRVPFIGSLGQPVLWVRAQHVARIDPFRSRE